MLDEEAGVRWIEVYAQSWALQYTPFEIAQRLQQFIAGHACAWIFTSATLAVGEDFSHFTHRIGVPEARNHLQRIEAGVTRFWETESAYTPLVDSARDSMR